MWPNLQATTNRDGTTTCAVLGHRGLFLLVSKCFHTSSRRHSGQKNTGGTEPRGCRRDCARRRGCEAANAEALGQAVVRNLRAAVLMPVVDATDHEALLGRREHRTDAECADQLGAPGFADDLAHFVTPFRDQVEAADGVHVTEAGQSRPGSVSHWEGGELLGVLEGAVRLDKKGTGPIEPARVLQVPVGGGV